MLANVDITEFGWEERDGHYEPKTGIKAALPPELSQVLACGCKSDNACASGRCSCKAAGLPCTTFTVNATIWSQFRAKMTSRPIVIA